MHQIELFRPKSFVVLPGDLAAEESPGYQANLRTLGLGLFFLGWVGENDVWWWWWSVCVPFLRRAWVAGRLWW